MPPHIRTSNSTGPEPTSFTAMLWELVGPNRSHASVKKKEHNPNFWVQTSSGGVRVLHTWSGWGPKSSVCPSKPTQTKPFGRISRIFVGISRGCPKIGRTPKGTYSSSGRSRHLLETPLSEPLLRTLLRTRFYCKTHSRPPSQNPSENPSQNPS